MQINVKDGCKKYRFQNYVLYDIDYLLDHQHMELELLKEYRKFRKKFKKRNPDAYKWKMIIDELWDKGGE